ncbi:MAG: transglycosylase SLT domain-containing protein [Acidobacteriota bacterium]
MNIMRWLLLLPAASALACASAPTAVKPAALAAAPTVTSAIPSQTADDNVRFRKEMEDVYAQIVARANKPVSSVPAADIDAALSMPIPDHRTIRGAINLFSTDLHGDIQTYLTRSARYRKLIEKALIEQNLPKGLAYLPVIESGYATTLTSKSGAHGIWQFMPETAREYGLRIDWWVDERADPERSTRAAAAYLKDLYRQFNDWPLVLAAYNAGPGRIRRALASTGTTTFWELLELSAVPKETRGYVPTFFATISIASDPAAYGFRLAPPIDADDRGVEVEGPLSLHFLAGAAHVDEAVLRDLNPAYRRGVLPPGRSTVRLPAKAADTIAARTSTLRNEDDTIAVCSFVMRKGDSIRSLARAIGTKADAILAMNALAGPDSVGEGDSIFLPVRSRELGSMLAHSADATVFYAVKKGDTVYSIARRHNLTPFELLELNGLDSDHTIHVGEKLRVGGSKTLTAGGM